MTNIGYPVYREPSPAEQREIDRRTGELAAALSRSLRKLTRAWRGIPAHDAGRYRDRKCRSSSLA
jgi:hypothetical protein